MNNKFLIFLQMFRLVYERFFINELDRELLKFIAKYNNNNK